MISQKILAKSSFHFHFDFTTFLLLILPIYKFILYEPDGTMDLSYIAKNSKKRTISI